MLHALLSLVAQAPDAGVADQVNLLVLALIGSVSAVALGIAKVFSAKIAGLPPIVRSLAMGGVSIVAVFVARFLHVDPAAGLNLFVESGVVALLGMGLRGIVHALGLDKVLPNAGS